MGNNKKKFFMGTMFFNIFFIGPMGMMTNNYRIYGTALLLIELVIVALGVKFVQLLAPVRNLKYAN